MDTFWRIVLHKRLFFLHCWHDIIEEDDTRHAESEYTSRIWTSDTVGWALVVVIGPDVMIIGTTGKNTWVTTIGGSVCERVSDRATGKAVLTPAILMFALGSGISRTGNRFLLDLRVGVVWTMGEPDWTWLPSCRTHNVILAFRSVCIAFENCESGQ